MGRTEQPPFPLLLLLLLLTGLTGLCSSKSHDHRLGNPTDDLIRKALETLKANASQGFPQWGIPPLDPLVIDVVPLSLDVDGFTIAGNATGLTLTNLSGFNIDKIHTSIILLNGDIELDFPELKLEGQYAIDGLIAELFPLYGGGPMSLEVTAVPLGLTVDLGLNGTHTQVKSLDFTFSIGTLDMQLHNIFNNEDMATVIDGFADDFGPLLVDILVNETRRDLIPKIIDVINNLLWDAQLQMEEAAEEENEDLDLAQLIFESTTADANEYFDRVLKNLGQLIRDNNLDPVALPEENFNVAGTGIRLHNGHLDGLSTAHRTGDAIMEYDGEWLTVSGHIGFSGLGAGYSCKIEVLYIGPDVTANAKITETSVFFAARISSKTLKLELVNFDVEKVGFIDVVIHGLGPFYWMLDPIVTIIANILSGVIGNLITSTVRPIITNLLDSIDLMSILENLF